MLTAPFAWREQLDLCGDGPCASHAREQWLGTLPSMGDNRDQHMGVLAAHKAGAIGVCFWSLPLVPSERLYCRLVTASARANFA